MSYMLLIIEQPGERTSVPVDERRRRYERMIGFAGDLAGRGILKGADSLAAPAAGAARIRKRGRSLAMVDGPFAEAKEIVGGFFLLDCGTREEAVAIADACPAAEWSIVEVRQVAACFEDAASPGATCRDGLVMRMSPTCRRMVVVPHHHLSLASRGPCAILI